MMDQLTHLLASLRHGLHQGRVLLHLLSLFIQLLADQLAVSQLGCLFPRSREHPAQRPVSIIALGGQTLDIFFVRLARHLFDVQVPRDHQAIPPSLDRRDHEGGEVGADAVVNLEEAGKGNSAGDPLGHVKEGLACSPLAHSRSWPADCPHTLESIEPGDQHVLDLGT